MSTATPRKPKNAPNTARSKAPTKKPAQPDSQSTQQDGGDVQGELALPHERDQSSHMTDGVPSNRVRQAAQDVERGLEDTSKATEMDRAYQKQR